MIRKAQEYLAIVGIKGLLCAIRAKGTKTQQTLVQPARNCKHPLRLRIPSSDVKTYKQVFLDQEYDFVVQRPPAVIVDAGANVGLASVYFANRFPDAKIISIEPEQHNFELLKANTAPYPNIIPVCAALWHKNEEINVIDRGLGEWGYMTEIKNPTELHPLPGTTRHVVPAMTVESILQTYHIDSIDILKIDIEGAEKEVFSDTSAWIDRVEAIVIELHENMKAGCNRSFYCGSGGFAIEWRQGENVCLSRGNCLLAYSK